MIVNQRVMWVAAYLLLATSAVLLMRAYRQEFNAIERRLDTQQLEIKRLTDTLGKTVNLLAESAKKEQTK